MPMSIIEKAINHNAEKLASEIRISQLVQLRKNHLDMIDSAVRAANFTMCKTQTRRLNTITAMIEREKRIYQ